MRLVLVLIFVCAYEARKKFEFEKLHLVQMDPNYGTMQMSAKRYNRTSFLLNMEMNTTKSLPDDTFIRFDIYKLSGNVYKKTALSFDKKFCDFIGLKQKNFFFDKEVLSKKVHFPDGCPVKKGYYWIKDLDPFIMLNSQFFSFLPLWQVKILASVRSKAKPIMEAEIYFEVIERP